ncbi:hypothetical protein GCM10014719_56540 [Planomonospora parontospora subsp. antibiotica]|nr:hypothetical protein GCM10014719_56540 [Planomonospora parontospora subsp. antibiotica]GII18851.1 hypothetical protein Ppa05_55770 [Planomonospora parontospora subsp. antibiotica]
MNRPFVLVMTLMCVLTLSAACQNGDTASVDRTPLPTVAAPPYICDHVPLKAVELMTGVRGPLARGRFNLTSDGSLDMGVCVVRRRSDQENVLVIDLSPGKDRAAIEEYLDDGATPLPEIVPGSIGAYFKSPSGENNAAYAHLLGDGSWLSVKLEIGVEGRDNAADVAAMMKLIAPKLITDARAPTADPAASPSASPSAEAASPSSTED